MHSCVTCKRLAYRWKEAKKKTFTLLLDPKQIKGMPSGLTPSQQAKLLAGSLHTTAQLDNIVMGEWRAALSSTKGAIPFAGGLLAAIWQWAALDKLAQDEQGAMNHEAQEAGWRLRAGTTALAGTIFDMAGQGLEKTATWVPKFAEGLGKFGGRLSGLGLLGGLIGGAIMAFWDGKNALNSFRSGKIGMGFLYLMSMGLGLVIAYMAFASIFHFIGWIVIIGLIGVTLLIELFKDNKIQAWLENGYWGGRTYKTPEEEQKQLELAVAG